MTVSVVIPVYNRVNLLPRAINSVLNQTFNDFELIIVDDASTDNIKEIVCNFDNPRIRYIRHEHRKGGGAARNTGIKIACGNYIALLDSDDEWLPKKLELQMAALSQAESIVGFSFCGNKFVSTVGGADAVTSCSEVSPAVQGNITDQLLLGIPHGCHLSGLVVKSNIMRAIDGFDPLLSSSQDWDVMIRLSQTCHCISIPQILSIYHKGHELGITKNLDAMIAGREHMLEKYWDLMMHNKSSLSLQYQELARFCLLAGVRKKALKYLIATLRVSGSATRLVILPWFVLIILRPSVFRSLIKIRRYCLPIWTYLVILQKRGHNEANHN